MQKQTCGDKTDGVIHIPFQPVRLLYQLGLVKFSRLVGSIGLGLVIESGFMVSEQNGLIQ